MVTFSFLRIIIQVNRCMILRLRQTSVMSNRWLKLPGFQEIWRSALLINVLLTIDHRNESDEHTCFPKTLNLSIKLWCVTNLALDINDSSNQVVWFGECNQISGQTNNLNLSGDKTSAKIIKGWIKPYLMSRISNYGLKLVDWMTKICWIVKQGQTDLMWLIIISLNLFSDTCRLFNAMDNYRCVPDVLIGFGYT